MARCLAAAISQAPGLVGIADAGHCSRAASSASWERSSARPTSRTMRVSPAMTLAASILQTASMARWLSVADTLPITSCRAQLPQSPLPFGQLRAQALFSLAHFVGHDLAEVLGLEHLPDLDLRFAMHRIGAPLHPFDRLFFRTHLPQPEPR